MRVDVNGRIVELILGDITRQETDAIVNAANAGLRGGGGVDGAIHRAGGPGIMAECGDLGGCPTGSACLTTGGKLKASYVIHAVGPIWRGGGSDEPELLAGTYQRSLEIADEQGLESISFPSISTGAYRYPLAAAADIALDTVINFLGQDISLKKVAFVLFNDVTFKAYQLSLNLRSDHGR